MNTIYYTQNLAGVKWIFAFCVLFGPCRCYSVLKVQYQSSHSSARCPLRNLPGLHLRIRMGRMTDRTYPTPCRILRVPPESPVLPSPERAAGFHRGRPVVPSPQVLLLSLLAASRYIRRWLRQIAFIMCYCAGCAISAIKKESIGQLQTVRFAQALQVDHRHLCRPRLPSLDAG